MRFTLSTGSLYTYGFNRIFALAQESGFDGIEVLVDVDFDTRQPAYLLQLAERYAMPILSVHASFWPRRLPAWPAKHPESIARTAELATAVGAEIVVVHLPLRYDRAYGRWLRAQLPDLQTKYPNLIFAVENMPLTWVRRWPFGPLNFWRMNTLKAWSKFPHLTLDTTHVATRGWDLLEVYASLRGQIAHVHLSNARRLGRRRVQEHRRLEDGFLPLGDFLARLAADGYAGVVAVEQGPEALDAQDEAQVRRHLREQVAFCRAHGGGLEETSQPDWRTALRQLVLWLDEAGVGYKVVGGTGVALHGVTVPVHDVDLEMSVEDAYRFQQRFAEQTLEPVALRESETYRSHFGRFEIAGLIVEVMGDLQRREDGRWTPTSTLTEATVNLDGVPVRVPWLEEETLAYIRRGRMERAALCLPHCDHERLLSLLRGERRTYVI